MLFKDSKIRTIELATYCSKDEKTYVSLLRVIELKKHFPYTWNVKEKNDCKIKYLFSSNEKQSLNRVIKIKIF